MALWQRWCTTLYRLALWTRLTPIWSANSINHSMASSKCLGLGTTTLSPLFYPRGLSRPRQRPPYLYSVMATTRHSSSSTSTTLFSRPHPPSFYGASSPPSNRCLWRRTLGEVHHFLGITVERHFEGPVRRPEGWMAATKISPLENIHDMILISIQPWGTPPTTQHSTFQSSVNWLH
jgi:hypothetical protein